MWTSAELAGIAKTFNNVVLSDFLTEKEIEVIPITARANLEQRVLQPKHNFPVSVNSLDQISHFLRLKQFKFNIFMQTWICSIGLQKLATVCDFKAPGCGSTFRSLCRKMKRSSMCSLRKLFQFKLTNFMTKKAGRNSLNFSAGRTNKTFSKSS